MVERDQRVAIPILVDSSIRINSRENGDISVFGQSQ